MQGIGVYDASFDIIRLLEVTVKTRSFVFLKGLYNSLPGVDSTLTKPMISGLITNEKN
jgi:hypothetical protein